MRVLLAHNFYRSTAPSGEDTVYKEERALLERNGVEVIPYERQSDDLDAAGVLKLARSALDASWSVAAARELSGLIGRTRPDVAHFHNTFPLISPSAYGACVAAGVPVVQTLHNYRLICPGAMLYREGVPCEDCVGKSLLPALRHRCYRHSLPATASVVNMLWNNRRRGTYSSLVQRYVALTEFARERFIAGGLPSDRIEVKPNALTVSPPAGAGQGGYAVFVGRLSTEKGVHTLLEAWQALPDVRLKVAGDGPLRAELEAKASQRGLNVEFLGRLERSHVANVVGEASMAIVPSRWFEGFPMVVVEAFACGTPVVASRLGSLAEIVREGINGRLFTAGDPQALSTAVRAMFDAPDALKQMRKNAREEFEARYSAEASFQALVQIYQRASLPEQLAHAQG
ncbi:glycosyltransferase [Peristeroidobacter soli]|uniref:glycosyltransferase n=1 Tax=Peristeroidobacter soli TaxID=2497877 RepID=UPI00101BD756|nr:glycosyltransferase [Peristeroidobacter soli]